MKRNRLKEVSVEVVVGTFMFMVLLALGSFTIILSQENLFRRTYEVQVLFDDVMGLRVGDNVFVRGVSMGKIKHMEVGSEGVLLAAALDYPVVVRQDYRVEILPSSVLGGRFLQIFEGDASNPPLPEGTVLRGITPVDLIDEASKTVTLLYRALDEGEVLERLKSAMRNIDEVTGRLNSGQGTLGRLLSDDSLHEQLTGIAEDVRQISGRLAAGEGTLGRLLSEDDTLYEDLAATVASLRGLASGLQGGGGTLGKLLNDDELYEEIKKLIVETRAAVDDFRENAPLTTFSSIFFGAL